MKGFVKSRLFWPVVVLVGMIALNAIINPGFLSVQMRDGHLYGSLIDILRNGAPLIIISLGMTLVIATAGIDLSVGAVAAVAGAMACTFIQNSADQSAFSTAMMAIGLALLLGLIMGAWNGFIVSILGIQPMIATLVLMTAGRGLAMLITGGSANVSIRSNPAYKLIGGGFVATLPFSILIAALVLAIIAIVVRRSALGMLIESVGINREASRLAGVGSRSIVWLVYLFCGLCATLAGLMITSDVSAADPNNDGLFIEMDAILAVVIGGTSLAGGKFSLSGTLVGALIIQSLTTTVLSLGIAPQVTLVFKAIVVIVLCLLQSPLVQSLLQRRRRVKTPPVSTPTPEVQEVAA